MELYPIVVPYCQSSINSLTFSLKEFDLSVPLDTDEITRIMDKNLKTLALVYVGIKFVKLDVELQNAPFFVAKLAIKALPCVILFKKGIDVDRLVGFQDLRSKEDFPTRALEHILILKTKGIIDEKKKDDDDDDEESEAKNRRVRSSTAQDSDSD
ncbi:Thioredoxin domain-containing protein PLP3B [Zea mays]|uniref:Thioredoxin domain-containing protein PLP3B n=1 Tax=Zea mays TaxID=4577 RepID=A0A1D6KX95_MAIZE|nr:Thioredoxin domain-containing protein PLP3B [Zea mays]